MRTTSLLDCCDDGSGVFVDPVANDGVKTIRLLGHPVAEESYVTLHRPFPLGGRRDAVDNDAVEFK